MMAAAKEKEEIMKRPLESRHLEQWWREKYETAAQVTPWKGALFQKDSF